MPLHIMICIMPNFDLIIIYTLRGMIFNFTFSASVYSADQFLVQNNSIFVWKM